MESKARNILNEIMQKLSAINDDVVTSEVDNIEVKAEEVTVESNVEEVALSAESVEADETTEEKSEVELAEETEQEVLTEGEPEEVEQEEGYVKVEDFNSKIAELEGMINSLKEELMVEYNKVEQEKEELSSQVQKLSAEPAAEPIAHAPSQKTETSEAIKFGQNRPASTLDRVFSKLK